MARQRATMAETFNQGPWYVFDFKHWEFLRHTEINKPGRHGARHGKLYSTWTPRKKWAKAYKNPNCAAKMAGRINAERGRNDLQEVTAVAAMCLDLIIVRDGLPASEG